MTVSASTATASTDSEQIKSWLAPSKAFRQGVAGFIAGAVSTGILHPLDLIKTRFQVDESNRRGAYGFRGTIIGLQTIFLQEGTRGMYRGISANLAGSTLSWGLYFWWYSIMKDGMLSLSSPTATAPTTSSASAPPPTSQPVRLSPGHHLVASAAAGALTSLFTNPFWLVKTRMCAERNSDPNAYRSLWDGLRRTYQGEGVRGLYKGLVPALFGVSHGALQFMAYEEMKRIWSGGDKSKLGSLEYSVMALSSKIFATVCTYPYQVVRSRLQNERQNESRVYKGTIGTVQRIYSNEGMVGFYKGLGPNLIRVLPGTIITFVVYEGVSAWLGASS
ncbi:mitochondrial carrier domain-containing protein [Zopfochytrium polystomum]|nr:mitochondrial carrier domain-containing protein [Zopfochytrium polystomum]